MKRRAVFRQVRQVAMGNEVRFSVGVDSSHDLRGKMPLPQQ
jgi:hypothetical protein